MTDKHPQQRLHEAATVLATTPPTPVGQCSYPGLHKPHHHVPAFGGEAFDCPGLDKSVHG